MGDGSTFNNFSAFRNHVWKMHFEQRGDGNGSGMKLIWRNGRNGDGDPGDHEGKVDPSSVSWRQDGVFHLTFVWTPGSYQVWVGETQPDGDVSGDRLWFQGSFARRVRAAQPQGSARHADTRRHDRRRPGGT